MKRYILTGTPGSGKTSLLHALKERGYAVVEEAATDIIAQELMNGNHEHWRYPNAIDKIIRLQRQRQIDTANRPFELQFYDRSPICTYALSRHLGFPPSALLLAEIKRIEDENIYQKRVFFIENLGFCQPTEVRKISFEDALIFEKTHLEVYTAAGYELIKIPPQSLPERVQSIIEQL